MSVGYQDTEIGLIPNDWHVSPLKEVAKFRTGPFGTLLKAEEYYSTDGVPLVSVQDIGDGVLNFGTHTPLVPRSVTRRLPEYVLRAGDIVFGRKGNIERSALVSKAQDGCFLGSDAIRGRLNEACYPPFVVYQLQMKRVQAKLLQQSIGTTMPSLNQSILNGLLIAVPPLPEQRAIAEALSDVDALIDSLDKLIAKKRDIKQGAMQELLSRKKRLPGFTRVWQVVRLGNIGQTYGGLSGKTKADFGHGNSHYVTFLNVLNNVVIDADQFDRVQVGPLEKQNEVGRGDLFFNGSSETPEEVGMCGVLLDEVSNVFLNSFCFGFRVNDESQVNGLYLSYYFRSREGRQLLYALAQGATRHNLSKTAFMDTQFPLPDRNEQNAIAQVLSDMDAEIAGLERRREKTIALKQGMMQELLTGRTRLV